MTPFSLAETWRLNNRANLMLLDSLSPDQLNLSLIHILLGAAAGVQSNSSAAIPVLPRAEKSRSVDDQRPPRRCAAACV